MSRLRIAVALLAVTWLTTPSGGESARTARWGFGGHEMATRAAVEVLPPAMPDFFREAVEQLVYLAPEPDRWRDRSAPEMDDAWRFDHYIDLENVPDDALDARNRFEFLRTLWDAGVSRPEEDGGLLPFRIVELQQRLTSSWRRWHDERDPDRRRWIEARIIDDAGLLAHYVTDGSQPQHTTIHFNGWASGEPNPEGFTGDRDFHSRFERSFVDAHVRRSDVRRDVLPPSDPLPDVRQAVVDYLLATHAEVERLHRLERDFGFAVRGEAPDSVRDFATERLAAGGTMLAALWWTAWDDGGR